MYVGRIEKLLAYYTAIPMCIVNTQGKITRASKKIVDVFIYDGIIGADIFALTGIKIQDIIAAAEDDTPLYLERNDKKFKLSVGLIGEGETASIVIYFIDVTSFETLKSLYNEEKECIAIINVDNYDEIIASTGESRTSELATEIDKLIRGWGRKLNAAVIRYRDNMYEMILTYKSFRVLVDEKFSILDEAREIETQNDFPVTLSIGIGIGGKNPAECDAYAEDALDLALGRGGDQAVVKNVKNFEYYGGKTQGVEKGFKGKSRIIAHALKTLMNQSNKVIIMGHKNPDMDSFGSALGIHRIAKSIGKDAYIVLNSYNDALVDIVADAKSIGEYEFVTTERALGLLDDHTLVVVVDTHRPVLVEAYEIVEKSNRTVIIDHHRRSEDAIQNTALSYMESYASSASELVSELVQYACEKRVISKFEADALLAGIMVDTNRFATKAGVRTFEAASWLRRNGADLEKVRRYFQADGENVRIRAMCVANAHFYNGEIAMSICPGENQNSQILNAQVADELMTIKGIKASFVAGINENGKTVVSARSLGDINVQVIMEKFGGGGHLNTAGTQTDKSPEEILELIREEMGIN